MEVKEAYTAGKMVIANKGGTRSTKTFSVLQFILVGIVLQRKCLISVVSESLPHLKRGALRDWIRILDGEGFKENTDYIYNRSSYTFTFTVSGAEVEFFSVTSDKARGAQRDVLFVNEANLIDYETWRQLSIRTSGVRFLDYNPTAVFWFDDHVAHRDGVALIHSTYLDNPFLSPEQVAEIESNKGNSNWWRVFGLGETGTSEGLIFSPGSWKIVERLPQDFKRMGVGIDFGFTNDPTAIVEVRLAEGALWVDCPVYMPGMLNSDIADRLAELGYTVYTSIVADSAEQKSIAEINARRFNVVGVVKGADSVRAGLQILQGYELRVTERSLDLIRELRTYSWKQDRNGKWMNIPEDRNNHAIDALRYAAMTFFKTERPHGIRRVALGTYC